jgi:hypothetical protein
MLFHHDKRFKHQKWQFKNVYAITIHGDHTWDATLYHPHTSAPEDIPEIVRPYADNYKYIMPLRGWIPLAKYDKGWVKFKRAMRSIFSNVRTGVILFHEDFLMEGKPFPISHAAAYHGEYDLMSPEFLKKVCESRLAANFSRSIDSHKLKLNWIIIAIVVMVVLGIFLKVTGVV